MRGVLIDADVIPAPVLEVCRHLEKAGFRAWIVGGCVRDLLMGKPVSDWDIATSALPGDVQATFKRTIPTGIKHGTVTVLYKGGAYEVTTLRGEGAYTDGRRPDSVELGVEIDRDLERRDFTVNAIAYDPIAAEVVDPWRGRGDIERKIIRAVRDPRLRFAEDGLRVLRAARFCASLGFTLDPETEAAIAPSLETFRKVSAERVHDEWQKAFKSAKPSPAFDVMRRTGILGVTCPRLAALDDATFRRALERVDRCAPDLRLAALLLDVGDPAWADRFLRDLRASNEARERFVRALAAGPVPTAPDDRELRRWMKHVGRGSIDDVLELARASGIDVGAIAARIDRNVPLTVKELAIGGQDVLEVLGGPPGKHIGRILEHLLDRVIDDPAQNDARSLRALLPDAARAVMEDGS
jgi:tRNA nucleotidyltransferase (CCA-adding enzyme)